MLYFVTKGGAITFFGQWGLEPPKHQKNKPQKHRVNSTQKTDFKFSKQLQNQQTSPNSTEQCSTPNHGPEKQNKK